MCWSQFSNTNNMPTLNIFSPPLKCQVCCFCLMTGKQRQFIWKSKSAQIFINGINTWVRIPVHDGDTVTWLAMTVWRHKNHCQESWIGFTSPSHGCSHLTFFLPEQKERNPRVREMLCLNSTLSLSKAFLSPRNSLFSSRAGSHSQECGWLCHRLSSLPGTLKLSSYLKLQPAT